MLRFGMVLVLLVPATNLHAQGLRGRNDSGECVEPCVRAGGMPCQPCLPYIGPGDENWDKAVQQVAQGNEQFWDGARDRAGRDPEYREHRFSSDRQSYLSLQESVRAMRDISRHNPDRDVERADREDREVSVGVASPE